MKRKYASGKFHSLIWKKLLKVFTIFVLAGFLLLIVNNALTDSILRPKFSRLRENISWLSAWQERIYSLCKNSIKDKHHPDKLIQEWLRKYENDIVKKLDELKLLRSNMNYLISDETNKAMNEFVCEAQRVTLSGTKACLLPLKDPKSMDVWRDKIWEQITSDLVYNGKIIAKVKSFFFYYFADRSLMDYSEPKCDVKNTPRAETK